MFSEYNGRQCQGVESTHCSDHGITCLGSEIEPQSLDEEFTNTVSSKNSVSHINQFLFSSQVNQSNYNHSGNLDRCSHHSSLNGVQARVVSFKSDGKFYIIEVDNRLSGLKDAYQLEYNCLSVD
jgi:hypothetical protein